MATAEAAPASMGPRYAPDDPTLPKPWLGLIDGSTGVLYYWNPETNVTQYEKPASLTPPLPSGPPPVASSAPKLAPIPTAQSTQPNGLGAHAAQQITQAMVQPGQEIVQLSQPHGQLMAQQQVAIQQGAVQQGSQLGQAVQQPGQVRPQMMQHSGQQLLSHMGQQTPQQMGQQMLLHHNSQMPQQQGQQYPYQQMQYMTYQQNTVPQGQQISQQQSQAGSLDQRFSSQYDYKATFPKKEDAEFQQVNQVGFSPSPYQQPGASSSQNLPGGSNIVSAPMPVVHPGQAQQFHSSAVNVQQSASMAQMQQVGADSFNQHRASRFQNQMDPSMMHNQQPYGPPVGLKKGFESEPHGISGNSYHFNAKMNGSVMSPHRPQFPPVSMARGQQESRVDGLPLQNVPPVYSSGYSPSGSRMHNTYGHATGGPSFPNNAMMTPCFNGASEVPNLSAADVYCQEHEVTATGDNIPAPFMTFEATGFPPEILSDIHAAGFLSPTPIQAQTWPIALQCRDIVAIAKTGSGKTLGYLIPAFMLLRQRHNNPQNGPTVLVLAPTRELATQIQDEAMKFGRSSRVSCTCLYGGASKDRQLRELDRGADIVVATPGRLNDILDMRRIDLRQVSLLVLDEADRMLDMGFEPQIRKIVCEIPSRRQTLMYTATWPKEVRKIAIELLDNPVQVNIGNADELVANKSITQYVEVVTPMERDRRLEQILRAQERGSKVIIFCSTKRLCDQLARGIGRSFGAIAIHGDKSQSERDFVLNQFRSGRAPVLVATDVAARGLDIKDIRTVINYDFPTGIEDYVHRIGRTGRAGATGVSYTFLSEQDWKHAADLVKVLEGANQHVPPKVREMAMHGGAKDRGGMNRFDSGSGGGGGGGGWDYGGRGGMRDGGFSRGGMRDVGFGGRSGLRDGNFGGRGGMGNTGFGGRGGPKDGSFGGRGGRNDSFSGRGNRGRGFGGPFEWGRNEHGAYRFNNMDGRGRGRGRGRFDGRRDISDRGGGRSYNRSPERVQTWGYSRSRSRSRSWSRSSSRSRSRSRSLSRSRSYSRSPRRSYSRSRSRSYDRFESRSRSRSYDRFERRRETKFDVMPPAPELKASESGMSPMSPGNAFSGPEQLPVVGSVESAHSGSVAEPDIQLSPVGET